MTQEASVLDRDAWLEARKASIGASEAAKATGVSEHGTPMEVWEEKTGRRQPEDLSDNEAVELGTLLEPVVAELYMRRTGRRIQRVNRIVRHPEYLFMHASLDRRAVGERRIIELKTAGFFAGRQFGDEDTDEIPEDHMVQVQHQLAVTGYPVADLAVLIAGQRFRWYEVPRDEGMIANLIAVEKVFWHHVETDTPPAIKTIEEARRVYPLSTQKPIEATKEVAEAHWRYRELKALDKATTSEIEALQAIIAAHLGENDTLTIDGRPVLTWKTQISRRFSQAALEADHPDLIDAYKRESPTRVMRLKEKV